MLRLLLARIAARRELPRTDWYRWRAARTVADLGELTACWLERSLGRHPGYGDMEDPGLDAETAALVPTLAKLNRAGLLTISSQPGHPPEVGFDGTLWEQRAAIELLCDVHTLGRLADRIETHPDPAVTALRVVAHPRVRHFPRPRYGRDPQAVTVTRWDGRDYTSTKRTGQPTSRPAVMTSTACGPSSSFHRSVTWTPASFLSWTRNRCSSPAASFGIG